MDVKRPAYASERARPSLARLAALVALAFVALASSGGHFFSNGGTESASQSAPINAHTILATCSALDVPVAPPHDFAKRSTSDRFVEGTRATLIKNATIWTGNDDGKEMIQADILLDKGIIKFVGKFSKHALLSEGVDVTEYNTVHANGWVTPGYAVLSSYLFMLILFSIVDLHSHIGAGASPHLQGRSSVRAYTCFLLDARRVRHELSAWRYSALVRESVTVCA